MSFLQNTALLQSLSLNHGNSSEAKSSIANLIQFVRNPAENVGEAFEYWRDGYTAAERVQKQKQDYRKQILYLKQRTVCSNLCIYGPPFSADFYYIGHKVRRLAGSSYGT